ncbi:FecR family protein [Haoranjiania flava]|uniref:FecR family protein n=1 Tax=Haoranjiania flava TaxID=1856322 RepID=A0AAE3LRC9_9BACT|nr:FecR family protein [Haoranjiania flava]MCU7695325.1 FecR family protein [Haoranjiania flava]
MHPVPDRIWHLLSRYLTNEVTMEEQREMEAFLRDNPETACQFEIHVAYFDNSRRRTEITTEDKHAWELLLKKIQQASPEDFTKWQHQPQRKTGIIRKAKRLYIAAAVVLLFVIAVFYISAPHRYVPLLAKNNVEYKTSHGEKTRLTLPDGSVVWLNGNSRIAYNRDFGKHNREVTLVGEAFFDVVHKAELPMVVHAGMIDVKVKGTAFNINSYPENNKIETSLIRGSVELAVAGQTGDKKKILMKPDEKVVIDTRSLIATAAQNSAQVKIIKFKIDTLQVETNSGLIPEVAWIENKLVFNSENFANVARKMEQWYNVEIRISNSSLMYEKFTGVFHTETLKEALDALKMTYHFNYTINKNKVIIE